MNLGGNIRALRGSLGLTLEELARRTGVSRAMLSDVERGAKNPTVKVAAQIAEGLGCTLSQLLGEWAAESPAVVRRDERRVLVDPETGVERHVLSPSFQRRGIEVLWYVIPPARSTGAFPPHRLGVEEHITVVQGRLEGRLGSDDVTLAAGDSVSFRADVEHGFRNPGPGPCHYFLVIDSSRTRATH